MKPLKLLLPFVAMMAAWLLMQSVGSQIRLKTEEVLIDVRVEDKDGKVVESLTREDFVLYEDKALRTITHFITKATPLRVALVIEAYGDVEKGVDRDIALGMVNNLGPEDQVALFEYDNSDVNILLDSTADLEAVKEKIKSHRYKYPKASGTHASKPLQAVSKYLQKFPLDRKARRVALFINSSVEFFPAPNWTQTRMDEVIPEIMKAEIMVCLLRPRWMERYLELSPFHQAARVMYGGPSFKDFIRQTGGDSVDVNLKGRIGKYYLRQSEIDKIDRFMELLHSAYELGFELSTPAKPGVRHEIKVELSASARKQYKGARLHYRQSYFAPEERPAEQSVKQ